MAATAPTRPSFAKRFSKWIDNISPSSAAIGFALVGIGILIGGSINFLPDFWTGTSSNLGVEFISIAITVIVIDRLNKREEKREKLAELIVEMGSRDNATAIRAVELLREYGWLFDGSLEGKNFFRANLRGANFGSADLRGAFFTFATLEGADLISVNLQGAFLLHANLQGAFLFNITCDEKTVLPDETFWAPDTDMERFTDPDHPNFWRSDNPESPAYKGRGSGDPFASG